MKNKFKNIIKTCLVLFLLFSGSFVSYAKTTEEIEAEIKEKQNELEQINNELENAESVLEASKANKEASKSEIAKVEAELLELETQLKVNRLKQEQVRFEIDVKKLEKEEYEKKQDEQIVAAYVGWKAEPDLITKLIAGGEDSSILKITIYHQYLNEETESGILNIAGELNRLSNENNQYEEKLKQLEEETVAVADRKVFLDEQIRTADEAIARANSNADGVRSKKSGVQQQIDSLTAEQQAIKQKENEQTGGGGGGGGTKPIETGEVYFHGTGRDLYQGHGVGMSQFGAYGAARNGMTAQQIVTMYYSNTRVETRTGLSINVEGYGTMSADNYAAGIGEVPSKACGSLQQIEDWSTFADQQGWSADDPKRNKYVLDNTSTVWDCWPEEAIKAQIIAARSYGVSSYQPICTTTRCQVYLGTQLKAWAAWETSNQYIISSGMTNNNQIIRALYSSDNSQGFGTANNDTVWSNFSGVGTPYSYLRHVNDTGVAASWTYTNWTWRTNSYNIDQIDQMFANAAGNYTTGGANSFLSSLKSEVGTVLSLTFTRDGSNRVKYVTVSGSKGAKNISGWLFKAIWNDWVYNSMPSGERDYIYSLTIWMQNG